MADFSKAYNNQSLSPNPEYPWAGLDPVWLTFNRFDIFSWVGVARRAANQDLIADGGWGIGTNVALVFEDGTILIDTIATITYAAPHTNMTFTTYNSEAIYATTVLNIDYTGYVCEVRIRWNVFIWVALIPQERIVPISFAPAGYASFDIGAYMRDVFNTHPEWLGDGQLNPLMGWGAYGPMRGEAIGLTIDFRVVANGYSGSYGWNGVGGDDCAATIFYASEYKGLIYDPSLGLVLPGSPNLYAQSARDDAGGSAPLIGGPLWEYGAIPMWRYPADGNYTPIILFSVAFFSDTAATLTVDMSLSDGGAWEFGNQYNLTENGQYHLNSPLSLPTAPTKLLIESPDYGAGNTFEPKTIRLEECSCPLLWVVWRNSVGGFSMWVFEDRSGRQNMGERGQEFASFAPDRRGYSPSLQNYPSNSRQQAIGSYRTPAQGEAKQITVQEGALTPAEALYLQSLLTSQEVWEVQFISDYFSYGGTNTQYNPITVTAGAFPSWKRANDLVEFSATLNIPLR